MSHYRDENRIITSKETSEGQLQRKKLCVEIGSFEFPYFSNSVRREIRKTGLGAFSPKLSAMLLQRKFEKRDSFRFSMSLDEDATPFSSSDIRKSMMKASESAQGSADGPATPGKMGLTPSDNPANFSGESVSLEISSKSVDVKQDKSKKSGSMDAKSGKKTKNMKKNSVPGKKEDIGMSKGNSNRNGIGDDDDEESKRHYNPIFIKQKQAGAVGYLRELCLFDGDDIEGDGDSMTALDSIRLVDMITTLANFSYGGNTNRMVRDGAAGALVSLVHGFVKGSDKQKHQNGRIACALRNLSCFMGNAPRMQKDGAIEAILELSSDSNLDVQQHCLCALCNFAGVKECAADMVSKGAVAAIMKMCDAMKNEELSRQCAVSLSNLAGVNETHKFLVGDGGVSALVELASHGLVEEDEEENIDTYGRTNSMKDEYDDLDEKDATSIESKLNPMITFYTRVPPRKSRSVAPLTGIDHIEAVLDHESTKLMESNIKRVSTTRKAPPAPDVPVLLINTVVQKDKTRNGGGGGVNDSRGDNGEDTNSNRNAEVKDDDEEEDDGALGASQVTEIIEKHIARYEKILLRESHLESIDEMRHEERLLQGTRVQHSVGNNVNSHKVEDNDIGLKLEAEMSPSNSEDGNRASDSHVDETKERLLQAGDHVRSSTGKYVHDGRGKLGKLQLEETKQQVMEPSEYTLRSIKTAGEEAERSGLRSRGVFPVQLPKGPKSGKLGLTKLKPGQHDAMFKDTNSFLGHLDTILGPLQRQQKSHKPRKQISGEWPFEK